MKKSYFVPMAIGLALFTGGMMLPAIAFTQGHQPVPHPEPRPQLFVDVDKDSIDDRVEDALLERFRPYYMFSKDGGPENFNPTDVLWYVNHACILATTDDPYTPKSVLATATPTSVLTPPYFIKGKPQPPPFPSADVTVTHKQDPNFHFSVIGHFSHPNGLTIDPENSDFIHGNPWQAVRTDKNLQLNGFYGHVARLRLPDPNAFNFTGEIDRGTVYYKVEYWQFFAFNSVHEPVNFGDHEGDWESVQVLYDPVHDSIVAVYHFAHGIPFRFHMKQVIDSVKGSNQDGALYEYHGVNYRNNAPLKLATIDVTGFKINEDQAAIALAQDNILRLFQDPVTGKFSHPVVYIEHSTHEFYPSQYWNYQGAPNHNGDDADHTFLTNTPPNLGEVEHLLTETPEAPLVLRWDGFWGAYDHDNTPPMGPAMHQQFTWPASSSIRWLLPQSMGF